MFTRLLLFILPLAFVAGLSSSVTQRIAAADPIADVSAAPPAIAPAPLPVDPITEIGTVEKLYRSGAFVDVGILVVFFVLSFASGRVPALQRDHAAAIVSALLGGLALLVVPATNGETPNAAQIIGALAAAATLLTSPHLPAALAAKRSA